jgi:hypothetical protein
MRVAGIDAWGGSLCVDCLGVLFALIELFKRVQVLADPMHQLRGLLAASDCPVLVTVLSCMELSVSWRRSI